MAIYDHHFMPINTISVHANKKNQFELAIKWLNYYNNKNISYISNVGANKIGQNKVDSFDKSAKNNI